MKDRSSHSLFQFYNMEVDDLFGGSNSLQHAREITKQVNSLCMAGGFPFQKWITNNPEILSSIPADRKINSFCLQFDETTTIQVLGLCKRYLPIHS